MSVKTNSLTRYRVRHVQQFKKEILSKNVRVVKKAKDEACFLGSGRVPQEVPPRDLPLSLANILKTFTSILSDFEGHKTGSDVEFCVRSLSTTYHSDRFFRLP